MLLSAEANNVRLAILEEPEGAYAQKVTTGAPQILRQTGETLNHTAEYVESNEITDSRQVADLIRVDIGAGGSIPFELSVGSYDKLFRAGLMSRSGWSDSATVDYNTTLETFTIDAVGNTITASEVSEVFAEFAVGDYIQLSNFVEAANNSIFRITAISTDKRVLTVSPGLTAEAPVDGTIVVGGIVPSYSGGATFAAAGKTLTAGTVGAFSTFAVGEWIKFTGSVTNLAGMAKISSIDATNTILTLDYIAPQDEVVVAIVVEQLESVTNGSRKRTFNIERTYTELLNDYALFVGVGVGGFSLSATLKSILTGSFEFLGSRELSENTPFGDQAYLPITTTKVMSSVDSVEGVFTNGEVADASDFTLTIDNALSAKNVLGTLGAKELGSQPISVKGTANIYYAGPTFHANYLNNNNIKMAFIVRDETGHGYIFDMPTTRLTTGDRASKGKGQDIMSSTGFQATMDATEGITIRIARF